MANRKITQFPAIDGNAITSGDLFTLVAVDEVNPTLKNKKITSYQFISGYLAEYFVLREGGGSQIFKGDVVISGNLGVSGHTTLNTLSITGQGTTFFPDSIVVTGDITATRNISGQTFSGDTVRMREADFQFLEVDQSGEFNGPVQVNDGLTAFFVTGTQNINGLTQVESPLGLFTTITGDQAVFTTQVSGATITGDIIRATSGIFIFLSGDEVTLGNVVVTGTIEFENTVIIDQDVEISGSLTVHSGIQVSGDVTVTGTVSGIDAQFTTITAETGIFTSFLSGNTISGTTIDIVSGATLSGERLSTFKEAQNEAITFAIALG